MSILPCTFLASALAIYVRQWQRKLAINFNISYIVCAFSAALLSTVDYGLFYTAIYAVCEWISEWREEWTRDIEKEEEGSTRGKISEKQKVREAARLKRSRDETKGEEKIEFEKMRMSSRGGKTAKEKNRKQQKKVMWTESKKKNTEWKGKENRVKMTLTQISWIWRNCGVYCLLNRRRAVSIVYPTVCTFDMRGSMEMWLKLILVQKNVPKFPRSSFLGLQSITLKTYQEDQKSQHELTSKGCPTHNNRFNWT